MLETIISSTTGESFTLANALLVIGSSIILGLLISLAYMYTHKKEGYTPGFTITLIMLPVIISIIILLGIQPYFFEFLLNHFYIVLCKIFYLKYLLHI